MIRKLPAEKMAQLRQSESHAAAMSCRSSQSAHLLAMRVAAAQMDCSLGDLAANLKKMRAFATRACAAGAELLVFPEVSDTGYDMRVIREIARTSNGESVPRLQEMAREFRLAIVAGVAESEGGAIYNSQIFFAADGKILGKYRKTHLFRGDSVDESECFSPGAALRSFSLGEFQIGLSICYDLRFPEIYRRLAVMEKANLLVISSAWPRARAEHLRLLARTRAIENQSYLVLANRSGVDGELKFCGESAIIDPSGNVLASAPDDAEMLISAELSLDCLTNVRQRMNVFAHRRPEIY